MKDLNIWNIQRTAGAFLVTAILPLALGIFLFFNRNGIGGDAPQSLALFVLERGLILTAVVFTALWFALLEARLYETNGRILARLGASTYFFGAVLLVAAEALRLPIGQVSYPLLVIYVVMAFIGEAAIGGALLQSKLVSAWIGWLTIAWNLGWLFILPITTSGDIYFPVLHHLIPLLIGISLLFKATE